MSDTRAVLEIIAPTIEEAITKGLDELGMPEEAVDIDILDEGSKGLFGLGSRQARVRLSIKADEPSGAESTDEPFEASATAQPDIIGEVLVETENKIPTPMVTDEEELRMLQVSEDTVSELLERMHVRAGVSAQFGPMDDSRGRTPVQVDISGKDLSILIGRQAETLNALQYIAGLMVGKEIGRPLTLVVDVEGYRKRRDQQLRQLARRMADQAIKTGRRQVLEPMPANERRIIHIELREHPQVTTESVGDEPRRKITINPK